MATKQRQNTNKDPFPYDGAIRRVDGVAPFNGYLWALHSDWWWANRELSQQINSRWNFEVVALQDGRYAVEGCVHSIERNEYAGKPIVYSTREQAIRVAAARMIRTMRKART